MMYEVVSPPNSTFLFTMQRFKIQLSWDNVFPQINVTQFSIQLYSTLCLLSDIQAKNSTFVLRKNFIVDSSISALRLLSSA